MKQIERFIAKNAALFEDAEPAAGHLERFEKRLGQMNRKPIYMSPVKLWMKVAAGLVILITATVTIIGLSTHKFSSSSGLADTMAGLPEEVTEILFVYEQRSITQMNKLETLAHSCPEGAHLIRQTREKVDQMDQQMADLITLAQTQPANEQVQTALIQQCKAKEIIMNDAILQGTMQRCEP